MNKYIFALIIYAIASSFTSLHAGSEETLLKAASRFLAVRVKGPTSSIPRDYARVHTVGGDQMMVPIKTPHTHFLSEHWVSPSFGKALPGTPHTNLHKAIHDMLAGDRHSFETVGYVPRELPPQDQSIRGSPGTPREEQFFSKFKTTFHEGLWREFDGVLTRPIVMTAMHGSLSKPPEKFYRPRFFLPVEQALYMRTIGEYRHRAALLKEWSAYGGLGVTSLPANTRVHMRVGMIAPQASPIVKTLKRMGIHNLGPFMDAQETLDFRRLLGTVPGLYEQLGDDPEFLSMQRTLQALGKTPEDIWDLVEFVPGGGVQLLSAYAHDGEEGSHQIPVYGVDALFRGGEPFTPNYSPKVALDILNPGTDSVEYWGEGSHFDDDGYDKTEFNLARAFAKHGVIGTSDATAILAVNKDLRFKMDVLHIITSGTSPVEALRLLKAHPGRVESDALNSLEKEIAATTGLVRRLFVDRNKLVQ